MTPNEYQKEALRTEQTDELLNVALIFGRGTSKVGCSELMSTWRLANGLMGLNGEAGEAIDILKKHLFQGHEFDREHLAKELGDVAWYLAVSANALGYTFEDILQMNVDKLRERYPKGFETDRSVNRKEGDI